MKLLLDSSFLIAYILPNDTLHKRAVELEEELHISDMQCYVTNNILFEVINVIGNRDSVELSKKTFYMINDSFECINEYDIPNFNNIAFKAYKKFNRDVDSGSKHKLGLSDCSIIEAARYYGLDAIVTFDSEFSKKSVINIIP